MYLVPVWAVRPATGSDPGGSSSRRHPGYGLRGNGLEQRLPATRPRVGLSLIGDVRAPARFDEAYSITPISRPAPPAKGAAGPPRCAFTIDVEDWYQSTVDFDAPISDRVLRNVERACAVLDAHRLKGTFFVQGRVAETFPRLLRELLAAGHEIQSHGYSHRPLFSMDRKALRTELEYARKTVEDACGVRVTAFRAPDFSIVRWEIGPHRVALPGGAAILEVPVAIATLGGMRIPVAGGGYFRLVPQPILDWALRSVLAAGRPVILYCHPYEFSPEEMDEFRGKVGLSVRVTQGIGRSSFIRRVHGLLANLPFGRFAEVMSGWRS